VSSSPPADPLSSSRRRRRHTVRRRPHRRKVLVADRTHVVRSQGHERLRRPGNSHELDLDTVRLVDLHDDPEVALPQAVLRKILVEHHLVELFVSHGTPPGTTSTASPLIEIPLQELLELDDVGARLLGKLHRSDLTECPIALRADAQ
jgi:hypothetical protein